MEKSMTHAQMTAEEWVEAVLSDGGDNVYTAPPIPLNTVVAHVQGGVYFATVDEVNKVLAEHYRPKGNKLRDLVIKRSNGLDGLELTHKETAEFYAETSTFELAIILAWYDSVLNGA
jgi:hypothetical protein